MEGGQILLPETGEKNKSRDYQSTGFAEGESRWLLLVQHSIGKNLKVKWLNKNFKKWCEKATWNCPLRNVRVAYQRSRVNCWTSKRFIWSCRSWIEMNLIFPLDHFFQQCLLAYSLPPHPLQEMERERKKKCERASFLFSFFKREFMSDHG